MHPMKKTCFRAPAERFRSVTTVALILCGSLPPCLASDGTYYSPGQLIYVPRDPNACPPPAPVPVPHRIIDPKSTAEHFQYAEQEYNSALATELAGIRRLFNDGRQSSAAFARQARSLSSTARAAGTYVGADTGLSQSLRAEFTRSVLSEADLDRAIKTAVNNYVRRVEQIDSALLVAIRADLPQATAIAVEMGIDREALGREIQRAVDSAVTSAQAEVTSMLSREVMSWITSDAVKTGLRQIGESTGLRQKGQPDNWTQALTGFGLDLFTNVIVDQVYERAFQPDEELTRKLIAALDAMEATVIDGTPTTCGLSKRLTRYTDNRVALRRQQVAQANSAAGK